MGPTPQQLAQLAGYRALVLLGEPGSDANEACPTPIRSDCSPMRPADGTILVHQRWPSAGIRFATMPKSSPRQRKTTGRVMHEFKHGELKSGPGGKGGKVKNRRQAIAIALKEAGASKYESEKANKRNLAKSARKEARGETYQQEKEGNSHVGASGRRESSRAMGRKNATKTTARGRKAQLRPSRRAGH
jgi:hypothetical protein